MATIKKIGKNNYQFRLSLGKDKDGKRIQPLFTGFRSKPEAEAAMNKILNEHHQGTYIKPSEQPFREHMEEWFETVYKKTVAESTSAARWYTVKNHLIPYFNKTPLNKITTRMIDQFYSEKIDQGLAPKSVRELHNLLNGMFVQAIKWKKLVENPVTLATPPKIKQKEIKTWSQEQAQQFLEVLESTDNAALFIVAIFTGMRRGEVLGLKWEDVDLVESKLHVVRSLGRVAGVGLLDKGTKTKKSKRQISISPFVVEALKQHQRKQESLKARLKVAYVNNGWVFSSFKGSALDPRNVLREFDRLTKLANLPKIRFHDLRHLHATLMLVNGENPKVVAERLGHSRVGITLDIYSHVTPDLQNDAAMRYEENFFKV